MAKGCVKGESDPQLSLSNRTLQSLEGPHVTTTPLTLCWMENLKLL
jgi:hypothetical protein